MRMQKVKLACVALFIFLMSGSPAFAIKDEGAGAFYGVAIGAGLGAAITILGAGYGFGRIGSAALESMARQPEVKGNIFTSMLLIGALLEGATFFALAICILLVLL